MATIDCDVPVDLDMNAMRAGEPDLEALRALFTELEFTSLLKELLPVVEVTEAHYSEAKSADDVEAVLKAVSAGNALAVAIEAESSGVADEDEVEADEPQESMLPLTAAPAEAARAHGCNFRGRGYGANRFRAGTRRSAAAICAGRRELAQGRPRLQGGHPRF